MPSNSNFIVKKYPLDIPRRLASNKIENEEQQLDSNYFPVIIPQEGSFFNLEVTVKLDGKKLRFGIDYQFDALNFEATELAVTSVYDAIVFRRNLKGKLSLSYHVIGEPWVNRVSQVQRLYSLYLGDTRPVLWENITGKPDGFPCVDHHHFGWDIKDWGALTIAIMDTTQALLKLHTSYEARIDKIVANAIKDNQENIDNILALLSQDWNRFKAIEDKINNINLRLNEVYNDFYAEDWVPETRKVNGHALENDIVLNNVDVGAASTIYKDTFRQGFNDELTNIGKAVATPVRIFNSMTEFFDLPVGYHGYVGTSAAVPFPTYRGWLHKLGYNDYRSNAYYLFYEESDHVLTWCCMPRNYTTYPNWIKSSSVGVPGSVSAYFGGTPPYNHAFLCGQQFDVGANPTCYQMFPTGFFPDARGMFFRGWDYGRGLDSESWRGLGSYQEDKMQRLTGIFSITLQHKNQVYTEGVFYDTDYRGPGDDGWQWTEETRRFAFDNARQARTGTENTVKNLAINWMITLG